MKLLYLLLATGLLAGACQKNEVDAVSREAEDPDWIKITVPTQYTKNADEAYAVAGSLDQTLLVAIKIAIYSSADRGKSWQTVRESDIRISGLLERNDTIFALGTITNDQRGQDFAISADAFTADHGKTWAQPGVIPRPFDPHALRQPIGRVTKTGITYQLKAITQPISATSYRTVGYELLGTDSGGQHKVRLPLPHRRYINLHLDALNYLYVTASGFLVDDVTNEIVANKRAGSTAVVYVSRRPLP